jgi:protein FrlC
MKGISYNNWGYTSFPVWVPSYTLDETIYRLASFGYDAIEIGCAAPQAWPAYLSELRRKEILKTLKSNNLKVSSLLPAPGGGPGMNPSSPLPEERRYTIDHYKEVIRLAHDLEGPLVLWIAGWVVHGTSQKEAREYTLEGLKECAEYAKTLGVTMVVEPTSADSNLIETADDALELQADTGMDNVKVMFDTYHALYRNEVSTDYVYRMGKELAHIHLADKDRQPPGLGVCDYPALIKALKEIDYQGYLTMEVGFHNRSVDPDWYARKSIEYLRTLL